MLFSTRTLLTILSFFSLNAFAGTDCTDISNSFDLSLESQELAISMLQEALDTSDPEDLLNNLCGLDYSSKIAGTDNSYIERLQSELEFVDFVRARTTVQGGGLVTAINKNLNGFSTLLVVFPKTRKITLVFIPSKSTRANRMSELEDYRMSLSHLYGARQSNPTLFTVGQEVHGEIAYLLGHSDHKINHDKAFKVVPNENAFNNLENQIPEVGEKIRLLPAAIQTAVSSTLSAPLINNIAKNGSLGRSYSVFHPEFSAKFDTDDDNSNVYSFVKNVENTSPYWTIQTQAGEFSHIVMTIRPDSFTPYIYAAEVFLELEEQVRLNLFE